MSAITPKTRPVAMIAGFRVSIGADVAEVEHTTAEVSKALRTPFKGRPKRLPAGACQVSWQKWFEISLPLAVRRISQLILTSRAISGYGREWVRANVLQPLASLNDDIVVPRPVPSAIGSADKETSEVALAVGGALLAANSGAPLSERATKIAEAQRELADLLEVAR